MTGGDGMDSLNTMLAFVKVVEAASFSGAARDLGVPKSTLSRRIARLETRLGAQLLVRTTRRLTTTDVGLGFYERCRRIVSEIEEAESEVREASTTPRGRLRVTLPPQDGNPEMARLVSVFLAAYPQVELDVLTTNRFVNLVEEGYDVAIRAGRLGDSSLIARRLVSGSHILVGAPDYLARCGTPRSPQALRDHDCLLLEPRDGQRRWLTADGQAIPIRGRLHSNDITIVRQAAIDGLGLAMLPTLLVQNDLERGTLVELLPEVMSQSTGIYVVYPPGRQLSAKVRAFIDHVVEFFAATEREARQEAELAAASA